MSSTTTSLPSVINEHILQNRLKCLSLTSYESFGTNTNQTNISVPLTLITNDLVDRRKEDQIDESTNDNALNALEVKAIDEEIDKPLVDGNDSVNVRYDNCDQREYAFKGRERTELGSMGENSAHNSTTLDIDQTSFDANLNTQLDIQTDVKMTTNIKDVNGGTGHKSNTTVDLKIGTKITMDSENVNENTEYESSSTSESTEQSITVINNQPEQLDLHNNEQLALTGPNEPHSEHKIQKGLEGNVRDHVNIANTSNEANQEGQHEEDMSAKMTFSEVNIDNNFTPMNDTPNSFPEGPNTTTDHKIDTKITMDGENVNENTEYMSSSTSISADQSITDIIDQPEQLDIQNNEQWALIGPNEPHSEHKIQKGLEGIVKQRGDIAYASNDANKEGQHKEDMCAKMSFSGINIDTNFTLTNDTPNLFPEGSNTTVDHKIGTKITMDSENVNENTGCESRSTSELVEQSTTDIIDQQEQFNLQNNEQLVLMDHNEPHSDHSIQNGLDTNVKHPVNIADTSNEADQEGQHEEDMYAKKSSSGINIDNNFTPIDDTPYSFPDRSNTTLDHQIGNTVRADCEDTGQELCSSFILVGQIATESNDQPEQSDSLSNGSLSPEAPDEPNAEHSAQECLGDDIYNDIRYTPINDAHDIVCVELDSTELDIDNRSITINGAQYLSPKRSSSNIDSYTSQPGQFDLQSNGMLSSIVSDGPAIECSIQQSVEDNTKGIDNITATSNQTNKEGNCQCFACTEISSMNVNTDVGSCSMNGDSNSSFFQSNTNQTNGKLIAADDAKIRSMVKKIYQPRRYNERLSSVIPNELKFESSDLHHNNVEHSFQEVLEESKKEHVNTACKSIQSHQRRERQAYITSKVEHISNKNTRMNEAQSTSVVKSKTDSDHKIEIEALSNIDDVNVDIGREFDDEHHIDSSFEDSSDGNTVDHANITTLRQPQQEGQHLDVMNKTSTNLNVDNLNKPNVKNGDALTELRINHKKKKVHTHNADDSINIRSMDISMHRDENIKNRSDEMLDKAGMESRTAINKERKRETQVASKPKKLNSTAWGDISEWEYQRSISELHFENEPDVCIFAVPFIDMADIGDLYQRALGYRDNQRSSGRPIISIRDSSAGPIVDLDHRIVQLRGTTYVYNTTQANETIFRNTFNTNISRILPTPAADQRISAPTHAGPAGLGAICDVLPTANLVEGMRKCYYCTTRPAVQQLCGHAVCCGDCNGKKGCPRCLA